MKIKKEYILLCIMAAIGLLLIGSSLMTGLDKTNQTVQEPETVKIWYYWETEGHQNALNHIIDEYNETQDDYKVKAEFVPFADFKKQLSISASADKLPDMVIIDSPDHASYAEKGLFADLTDKIDVTGYYEATIDSCTFEDVLYGVPFGCNCLALYYNEDMLKEHGIGVPTTWEELKSAAFDLTGDGITGFAMSCVQDEEGTFGFMPFLWSAGASYDTMGSEEAVSALTLFQALTKSGAMSKECITWRQADVMEQFASGKVALMINGSWQIPTLKKIADDINWKVALIPKDKVLSSDLGGENYAVIEGGNEEGALAFLKFAMMESNVRYLMDAMGYIAADKEIANNQFQTDENDAYQIFVRQLEYAKARGPHKDWPEISDAVSLAFHQVITGEKKPEEAAKEAQKTINAILK